jgi:biotin synthase-like enzyme
MILLKLAYLELEREGKLNSKNEIKLLFERAEKLRAEYFKNTVK